MEHATAAPPPPAAHARGAQPSAHAKTGKAAPCACSPASQETVVVGKVHQGVIVGLVAGQTIADRHPLQRRSQGTHVAMGIRVSGGGECLPTASQPCQGLLSQREQADFSKLKPPTGWLPLPTASSRQTSFPLPREEEAAWSAPSSVPEEVLGCSSKAAPPPDSIPGCV